MINTASFVGKMGAATPQLACQYSPLLLVCPGYTFGVIADATWG